VGPLSRPRSPARRRVPAVVALLVASWTLLVAAGPASAADPVTFGDPTATSGFGDGVDFAQPATLPAGLERVEILVSQPGAIGPTVHPVEVPSGGSTTLRYHLDAADGALLPNTPYTARWRAVAADGTASVGPAVTRIYADDRFDWKTLNGDVVRVHWIEGDQAFGQRALKIGDDAVKASADLLGVTETEPLDFFIYADQSAFYDALGPGTPENVGGEAHPDIRTLFALIRPSEINASWVESVVPHELTHVVFHTAVQNPYHDPPHWLDEGLAVYEADGYTGSYRQQVVAAAKDGTIIPLDGLSAGFPAGRDAFFLAYAESVSAVDRIVRVAGRDALVRLIRSYHDGVSDDEAFRAALGVDVAGFQRDWLAELHAGAPVQYGPRPAPVGPLPAGWNAPQPDPSFEVTGSLPPRPPNAPRPGSLDDDPLARVLVPMTGVIGLVLVLVIGSLALRRARLGRGTDPDAGWNRLIGRPRITDDERPMDDRLETRDATNPDPAADVLPGIRFGPGADDDVERDDPEEPSR
jgi:peptidase MA superfamily protein